MAIFICTGCNHHQPVDDKYVGRSATCPKCNTSCVVHPATIPPSVHSAQMFQCPRRLETAAAGVLGIRCDSWLNRDKHLNKASSLRLQWNNVCDDTLPIRFSTVCGVRVHNVAADYPLSLEYQAETKVECAIEAVAAFEVKYLTFDVWGRPTNSLCASEIVDFQPDQHLQILHRWDMFSTTEAMEFCESLCFVSRVRTLAGAVLEADMDFVLKEARRISARFTEANLEPKVPERPR